MMKISRKYHDSIWIEGQLVQGFSLNGAMLNGSSLLLVQNVSGQTELEFSNITWILVKLQISGTTYFLDFRS